MGFSRIAAHDDLRLRIADVGVTVGHRAVAPGEGYAHDGGRMTNTRLVIRVVGAPEASGLANYVGPFIGHLRGAEPVDGIGTRLAANLRQLVANLIDGLVPANAGPLSVHKLHRILQTTLAADKLAD